MVTVKVITTIGEFTLKDIVEVPMSKEEQEVLKEEGIKVFSNSRGEKFTFYKDKIVGIFFLIGEGA